MIRTVLRRLVDRPAKWYECRDCGATIDEEVVESCPTCGSTEIAVYTL